MNMRDSMNGLLHVTAMDAIVGLALLFSLLFLAAWLLYPGLREWVERPKFHFQAAVELYDHAQRSGSTLKDRKTPQ